MGEFAGEHAVSSEGELVGDVGRDVLVHVEVGVGAALAGANVVAYEAYSSYAGVAFGVGEERDVIVGVREGVVEVELQTVREVFSAG